MDKTSLRERVLFRLGWAGQEDVERRFGESLVLIDKAN